MTSRTRARDIRRTIGRSLVALVSLVAMLAEPAVAATGSPSRREARDMLLSERFDELDASLSALQQRFEKNGDLQAEDWLGFVYGAFDSSSPTAGEKIDRWKQKLPASCFAKAADGSRKLNLAQIARGGRWASETQAAQFRSMQEYLREAVAALQAATICNRSLTIAWSDLVVAGQIGSSDDTARSAHAHGLDARPESLLLRVSWLLSRAPKWGGSLDEVAGYLARAKPEVSADAFAELSVVADVIRSEELRIEKKAEEALALLERSPSGSWRLYSERALVHQALGRFAEAQSDLDRALAQRPDSALLLEQRARVRMDTGKYEDALADLNVALAYDENDPGLLSLRAWLYNAKLGKPDDALKDAGTSLALGSQRSETWRLQGWSLLSSKNDAEGARRAFAKAIELAPEEPDAWFGYGAALYAQQSSASLDAFDRFAYLCGRGAKCAAKDVAWLDDALGHGALWFYWPRAFFRPHLVRMLW